MDKDIDRIQKNPDTDIVIRVDDFGGRRGLTIREFVKSDRYTGFTKAGTRIPADKFAIFKKAINSVDEKEMMEAPVDTGATAPGMPNPDANIQQKFSSGKKESGAFKKEKSFAKKDVDDFDFEGSVM